MTLSVVSLATTTYPHWYVFKTASHDWQGLNKIFAFVSAQHVFVKCSLVTFGPNGK